MNGYYGRLLRVDLGSGAWWVDPIPEDVLRRCIGGVGLGTALLLRYCPPGVEPLAPQAPLIFVSSPLVGTAVTTTAKFAVLFKSPLTGFIGDSLSSSHLALALKRTGYDALVLTGRCADWSTLVVAGDSARSAYLRPAGHLLGLGTRETEQALRDELAGEGRAGARTCAIGPAGERLVRYATISNDGRHAGRCGGGTVMGAKRLKAIAVFGRQRTGVADPVALRAANARLIERSTGPATAKYRELGTPANLLAFDRLGVLPARNFQAATFDGAERISGEALYRRHLSKTVGCASCTVGCEHLYKAIDREAPGDAGGDGQDGQAEAEVRLEYETLFALGPLLGIADPNAVIRLARACDDLGLDTLSTGGTIAWAMETAQRGLLPLDRRSSGVRGGHQTTDDGRPTTDDGRPDGLPSSVVAVRGAHGTEAPDGGGSAPRFGDAAGVARLLDAIAHRRGWLGNLLAEGSRRAAQTVGRGSDAWAMHVKGLELPGYEPRGLQTMALGFAVTPRGACHNRSAAYEADFSGAVDRFAAEAGRGQLAAAAEDQAAVLDSLILCKFIRKCFDDLYEESAQLLRYVTGWDVSGAALRRAGERISTLKKLFNVREGWTRADDTLPPRILEESLAGGPGQGERLTRAGLDLMIEAYYAARGWDHDGHVPARCLQELDLEPVLRYAAAALARGDDLAPEAHAEALPEAVAAG